MLKSGRAKAVSIFLIIILILSLPFGAYADTDSVSGNNTEIITVNSAPSADGSDPAVTAAAKPSGEDSQVLPDEEIPVFTESPEDANGSEISYGDDPLVPASAEEEDVSSVNDTLLQSEDDSLVPSEDGASVPAADESADQTNEAAASPLDPGWTEDEQIPAEVNEEEFIEGAAVFISGTTYYSLTKNSDGTYTMEFSGSGVIPNYSYLSYAPYTTAPWANYRTSISKVIVGADITQLGDFTLFSMPNLKSITFKGNKVASINEYALSQLNMSKITLPSGVKTIAENAFFSNDNLSSINIPSTVTKIDNYAFYDCFKLTSVTLPSSLTYVGNNAFKDTKTISYYGTADKWKSINGPNCFSGTIRYLSTVRTSIKGAKVTGVMNKSYTGAKVTLSLKVTLGGKTLKNGTDYTLTYSNNVNLSTSSKPAKVTIKGIGNYKDSLVKTFKIVKGTPGLKFSSKSVTKKATLSSYTMAVKKAAKASVPVTYKSSNNNVATVNSKGKVTIKGTGTATITASNKETKYFKASSASYKLTVRALTLTDLSYSFGNYGTFIPISTWQIFYNPSVAQTLYNKYWDISNGGVCYGMASSSIMLNTSGSNLKVTDFSSSAKNPSQLGKFYYYKTTYVTLQNLIEAMFVSQCGSSVQQLKAKNKNKLASMVAAVKSGKPVIVEMFQNKEGGHAVVGYKVKHVSSSKDYLYIYDSNKPQQTAYITLSKSNGKYTGWSYPIMSGKKWVSSKGWITFETTSQYLKLWKSRKGRSPVSKMIVNSNDFEVTDANGAVVASMKNGTFSSSTDEIYEMAIAGDLISDHMIYLPSGAYTVTNTGSSEGFELTAFEETQTLSVATTASTVCLDVNDENNSAIAVIKADQGDDFEVTVRSDIEGTNEFREIAFEGTGCGKDVTLGTEDGSCVMDNADDVLLTVDGEETAYIVSR